MTSSNSNPSHSDAQAVWRPSGMLSQRMIRRCPIPRASTLLDHLSPHHAPLLVLKDYRRQTNLTTKSDLRSDVHQAEQCQYSPMQPLSMEEGALHLIGSLDQKQLSTQVVQGPGWPASLLVATSSNLKTMLAATLSGTSFDSNLPFCVLIPCTSIQTVSDHFLASCNNSCSTQH